MAIVVDKKRNRYYINYKINTNGKRKNINIRNKNWIVEGPSHVTMRYMRKIELSEINKDREHRQVVLMTEGNMKLIDLINSFCMIQKTLSIDDDTIYNYRTAFTRYLLPICDANMPIDKVFVPANIDKIRLLLSSKNMTARSFNNNLSILKKLIIFAKQRKLILRENADDCIDLLVHVKDVNHDAVHNNFFIHGDEDVDKFITTFNNKDIEWRIPILTMFYAALRIGEWQAIQKKDINFDECTIIINKQINSKGMLKNKTKNNCDKIVRLPKQFMDELKKYIEDRQINNEEFVFLSKHNKPVTRYQITSIINSHLKLAGLPHITPHGLRHSFATRMFDRGYDVKEVQMQLGHKNMNTTMQYYIHYTQSKQKKNVDDLL